MKTFTTMSGRLLLSASLLALGGVLLSGCVGAAADEDVAEAESAIGESTCATTTPNTTDTLGLTCFTTLNDTSADASYNHTDCTNGFVVSYTGTWTAPFAAARASWVDALPTTSTACTTSSVTIYTYNSSGTQTATNTTSGSWNGTTCSFPTPLVSISTATPVRAVAQAKTGSTFHKVKITVGPTGCGG